MATLHLSEVKLIQFFKALHQGTSLIPVIHATKKPCIQNLYVIWEFLKTEKDIHSRIVIAKHFQSSESKKGLKENKQLTRKKMTVKKVHIILPQQGI